jgi:hypothetical protein
LYRQTHIDFLSQVLLYRFFEDSTVDFNQWRVVLNLIEAPGHAEEHAPRFDEERHAGVCSEVSSIIGVVQLLA